MKIIFSKQYTELMEKWDDISLAYYNLWHYITEPFDFRYISSDARVRCDVTLLRDGYYFIKEITSEK